MKKFKYIISILCAVMLISSCDKEESNWYRPTDLSNYIPDEFISLSGSYGITNNSADFNYQVSFIGDLDFWQLKVNSVEYYFDGMLVEHKEASPYEVKYQVKNLPKGKHVFTIKANLFDLYSNKHYSLEKDKEIVIQSDGGNTNNPANSLSCSYSTSIAGNNVTINITQVLLSYQLRNDNWEISGVSYYLDSEFIGKSINSPYAFTHFAKLQQGIHQLKLCADIYNSVTQNNDIVEKDIEFEVK